MTRRRAEFIPAAWIGTRLGKFRITHSEFRVKKMGRNENLNRRRIPKRRVFDQARGVFKTAVAQLGGRLYDSKFNLIYTAELLDDLANLSDQEYADKHECHGRGVCARKHTLNVIVKRLGNAKALELFRSFNPAFEFSTGALFFSDEGATFFRGYFLMDGEIERFREVLRARAAQGIETAPLPQYVDVWKR